MADIEGKHIIYYKKKTHCFIENLPANKEWINSNVVIVQSTKIIIKITILESQSNTVMISDDDETDIDTDILYISSGDDTC